MTRVTFSLLALICSVSPTITFAQSQIYSGGSTTGAITSPSSGIGASAPQATSGLANQPSNLSPYASPATPSNETQSPWLNYYGTTRPTQIDVSHGGSVSGTSSSASDLNSGMSSQSTGEQPTLNGPINDSGRAPTTAPYTGPMAK